MSENELSSATKVPEENKSNKLKTAVEISMEKYPTKTKEERLTEAGEVAEEGFSNLYDFSDVEKDISSLDRQIGTKERFRPVHQEGEKSKKDEILELERKQDILKNAISFIKEKGKQVFEKDIETKKENLAKKELEYDGLYDYQKNTASGKAKKKYIDNLQEVIELFEQVRDKIVENTTETETETKVEAISPTEEVVEASEGETKVEAISPTEEVVEASEGETNQESAESKEVIEELSEREREKVEIGLNNLGFYIEAKKDGAFARILDVVLEKVDKKKVFGKWISEMSKTFRKDQDSALKKMEAQKKGKKMRFANMMSLSGNLLRYGRVVADAIGYTAASSYKYVMMAAMMFSRGSRAAKEVRFKNEELMKKTRIDDADEAAVQAWEFYRQFQKKIGKGKEGDKKAENLTKEEISRSYTEQLPKDIKKRLEKIVNKEGIMGVSESLLKKHLSLSVERIQKKIDEIENNNKLSPQEKRAKKDKIYSKYESLLNDYDRMLTQAGTVDALAYSARLAEKSGKAVVIFASINTLYRLFDSSVDFLLEHVNTDTELPESSTTEESSLASSGETEAVNERVLITSSEDSLDTGTATPSAVSETRIEYQGGKSVWQEAEKQLAKRFEGQAGFESLSEADKTYDIDKLKDLIEGSPEKYGLPQGVDLNKLSREQIADIDWNQVIEDSGIKIESLDPGLTLTQETNIENNNNTLDNWAKGHPHEELNTAKTEEILNGNEAELQSQAPAPTSSPDAIPTVDHPLEVLSKNLNEKSLNSIALERTINEYLSKGNDYSDFGSDVKHAFAAHYSANADLVGNLSSSSVEEIKSMLENYKTEIHQQTVDFFRGEFNSNAKDDVSFIEDSRNPGQLLIARHLGHGKWRFFEMNDDGTIPDKPINDSRGIFHRARKDFTIEQAKKFFGFKDESASATSPEDSAQTTETEAPAEEATETTAVAKEATEPSTPAETTTTTPIAETIAPTADTEVPEAPDSSSPAKKAETTPEATTEPEAEVTTATPAESETTAQNDQVPNYTSYVGDASEPLDISEVSRGYFQSLAKQELRNSGLFSKLMNTINQNSNEIAISDDSVKNLLKKAELSSLEEMKSWSNQELGLYQDILRFDQEYITPRVMGGNDKISRITERYNYMQNYIKDLIASSTTETTPATSATEAPTTEPEAEVTTAPSPAAKETTATPATSETEAPEATTEPEATAADTEAEVTDTNYLENLNKKEQAAQDYLDGLNDVDAGINFDDGINNDAEYEAAKKTYLAIIKRGGLIEGREHIADRALLEGMKSLLNKHIHNNPDYFNSKNITDYKGMFTAEEIRQAGQKAILDNANMEIEDIEQNALTELNNLKIDYNNLKNGQEFFSDDGSIKYTVFTKESTNPSIAKRRLNLITAPTNAYIVKREQLIQIGNKWRAIRIFAQPVSQ